MKQGMSKSPATKIKESPKLKNTSLPQNIIGPDANLTNDDEI